MPYYGQGNRTPMEKARGLLIAEIDRKNEIIKYLDMDMFDKKRMFIGNIETEEISELKHFEEERERNLRNCKMELERLRGKYFREKEEDAELEMRKIDELSNERMKVVKENSRWAKKRVGDLYGSFYESFIVLMGKQLESMKKDLEEFPERKSTALISSSFEQQKFLQLGWIERVLNQAGSAVEQLYYSRVRLQAKSQEIDKEAKLWIEDECEICKQHIKTLKKDVCWKCVTAFCNCKKCKTLKKDIATRQIVRDLHVEWIEKNCNYQKAVMKSLDDILKVQGGTKNQFWDLVDSIKKEIGNGSEFESMPSTPSSLSHSKMFASYEKTETFASCSNQYSGGSYKVPVAFSTPIYPSNAKDPEQKKLLDQVIEQQKIRKEAEEQTKDMSLAELMSKFGIEINNTTDSDDRSQNSPDEKPMDTSERPPTPEQETTPKTKGKTLPKFEFLRTYPSQFELKKEPETLRNTGFENDYPFGPLVSKRVENSYSSGTMGSSSFSSRYELPKSTEKSGSILGPRQSSNKEISDSPYRYELNESLERSQQSQEKIQINSPRPFSETRKEKERVETALSSQKNLPDRVKELLEQAERKRDETRRQYENEKARREKIREEKRLQLEELERKDREKEEKAARELAEFDKRIQDDERKSQKPTTPEQETTPKTRGKTLPRFEFLRTYPSQFELKKEPETPKNTGFEGGYPSSQLFLNRVENSFSSSSGTMGISNFSSRHEEVPKEDWTAKNIFETSNYSATSVPSQKNYNVKFAALTDSERADRMEEVAVNTGKIWKSQSTNRETRFMKEILAHPTSDETQARHDDFRIRNKESSDRVKEILEQTERKREETRKRYEEEKVRREKSREEKRLQLEELKRKEQEIDDNSARQLEELEKRLADEEIQKMQKRKKVEEDAAERSLREEKERKRAEEAWNRVIAQIKRNMFVESKWDKWFGQVRDAVSPLITSLRKVLFDVKTTNWEKAHEFEISNLKKRITSTAQMCSDLSKFYERNEALIVKLMQRSEAPFLKDIKERLKNMSGLLQKLSETLAPELISTAKDKIEEWDVIDKLSEEVEKTAQEIPSTYDLKQKYKGYTETSEKSKEKLLEISST